MDTSTKRPWASMTFWGVVISLAGMLAPQFGIDFNIDDQAATTEFVASAMEVVGLGIALWGRMRAKTRVTLRAE